MINTDLNNIYINNDEINKTEDAPITEPKASPLKLLLGLGVFLGIIYGVGKLIKSGPILTIGTHFCGVVVAGEIIDEYSKKLNLFKKFSESLLTNSIELFKQPFQKTLNDLTLKKSLLNISKILLYLKIFRNLCLNDGFDRSIQESSLQSIV
jgi:hypothetical protein